MTVSFRKMHGLGNDFVVVDVRQSGVGFTEEQVRRIGDRRRGIGFDQFITIEPPRQAGATIFMGIRNPDGSVAGACGNATRCVSALLMAETGSDAVVIETVSGLLPATRTTDGTVTVDMGPARLDWQDLPLAEARDTLHLGIGAGDLHDPVGVSMGNPHAVFFVEDVAAVPLTEVGPVLENHALFPKRCNIEIVEVQARDRLRMRVWERGAGITQACGSGACATLVAAARRGLADRRAEVILDGGSLMIEWRDSDGHVLMSGPTATSFTGIFDGSLLA
ncbi:diaminopimelate epimerase [Novispirillum itersonii]|uniref:Diaminopimelate epimerase n=1 Tax=Novispirillum itersonii TaxID=189 RepID=A0A7W9ZGH2_NOVIT|nr:diaminopimelate epimerase [Novispirillum itersonii]MBB6209849.1 diaminopimelate epimerase [Novispirillum itersonii]